LFATKTDIRGGEVFKKVICYTTLVDRWSKAGIFGAGLLATGQLGISQGLFAIGAITGPALGPPLGEIRIDNASWNRIFDINVVPGIVPSLIMLAFLRDPARTHRTPLDIPGSFFPSPVLDRCNTRSARANAGIGLAIPTIASPRLLRSAALAV
jgi:hypothetical protein